MLWQARHSALTRCMDTPLPIDTFYVLQMATLIPTSLIMHNFWDFAEGSPAHQIEFMNFVKVCPQRGAQYVVGCLRAATCRQTDR